MGSIQAVIFSLVVFGFGIAYLVMGNTGGRIVGISLAIVAATASGIWLKRRFAKRTAKP